MSSMIAVFLRDLQQDGNENPADLIIGALRNYLDLYRSSHLKSYEYCRRMYWVFAILAILMTAAVPIIEALEPPRRRIWILAIGTCASVVTSISALLKYYARMESHATAIQRFRNPIAKLDMQFFFTRYESGDEPKPEKEPLTKANQFVKECTAEISEINKDSPFLNSKDKEGLKQKLS